jgi:hypothetical protein
MLGACAVLESDRARGLGSPLLAARREGAAPEPRRHSRDATSYGFAKPRLSRERPEQQ